jgi:gamma-aminobutyric acid receptor subunit alpha
MKMYFVYSVSNVWGNNPKSTEIDGNIYLDNITRILDRLLDGYDNRLRPGFGGTVMHILKF